MRKLTVVLATLGALSYTGAAAAVPAVRENPLVAAALPSLTETMTALAAPIAGIPNLVVQCAEIPYAGLAYPSETPPRIVVSTGDCELIERIEWHQRFPTGTSPLRVLLHEAVHIRQGPTGPWNEHDAECGSLAALGSALATLGYDNDWINTAVHSERRMILQEQAPYGGECPAAPDRPAGHRMARYQMPFKNAKRGR